MSPSQTTVIDLNLIRWLVLNFGNAMVSVKFLVEGVVENWPKDRIRQMAPLALQDLQKMEQVLEQFRSFVSKQPLSEITESLFSSSLHDSISSL